MVVTRTVVVGFNTDENSGDENRSDENDNGGCHHGIVPNTSNPGEAGRHLCNFVDLPPVVVVLLTTVTGNSEITYIMLA
jgi:hypothetical protein